MTDYTDMNKVQLRAACKEAGVKGYGSMSVADMRLELQRADKRNSKAALLSNEDRKQIADEANDRNSGNAPKDDHTVADDDDTDETVPPEVLAAEDEFERGVAEEAANRKRIAEEAQAAREQTERDAEANHPMLQGKQPAPASDDKPKAPRASSGTSNGLKIEANREERNGVRRPSIGGKCRAVWDMLDGIGLAATAKQAREEGGKRGYDKTTTMVQFYRWRAFNGISGRQS